LSRRDRALDIILFRRIRAVNRVHTDRFLHAMNTSPPSVVLTWTSLIMNRVLRSRTVSPDLMYFAFSIIFTLCSSLTRPLLLRRGGETKPIWGTNNPLNSACLDTRRHSIDISTPFFHLRLRNEATALRNRQEFQRNQLIELVNTGFESWARESFE